MKYLVDKKTKEHRPYYGGSKEWAEDQGLEIVRADSEGWIAHTGSECPISKYQPYQARLRSGSIIDCVTRWSCYHNNGDVLAYRPILTEKAQEPAPKTVGIRMTDSAGMDLGEGDFTSHGPGIPVVGGLLCRLKAAHNAAQQIPDLEKELREVLAGMGYTLGKLSPFVETEDYAAAIAERKQAVKTKKANMSDWRK